MANTVYLFDVCQSPKFSHLNTKCNTLDPLKLLFIRLDTRSVLYLNMCTVDVLIAIVE